MKKSEKEFLDACLGRCKGNELDILKSEKCVCAACGSVFSAREVVDWDNWETGSSYGLCPQCGFGYLIGDAFVGKFEEGFAPKITNYLHAQKEDDPADSWYRFCELYMSRSLSERPQNTALFVEFAIQLALDLDEYRFLSDALKIIAFGTRDYRADPGRIIELVENGPFHANQKALSILGLVYFNNQGNGSKAVQSKKAFQFTRDAALLGDLTSVAFLSSMYLEGIGTKPDEKMARALLANHFPRALAVTLEPRLGADLTGAGVFLSHYADYILFSEPEEGAPETNYRDIIRFYLLAKQLLIGAGVANEEELITLIDKHIKEAGTHFTETGFDQEMILDSQSFYDTFIDMIYANMPIYVESASFDRSEGVVTLTLAPFNHFILVDTSSASARVVSKESVTFHFEGVVSALFPDGPFVFTHITTPPDAINKWQIRDGADVIAELEYDPLYMEEED